MNKLIKGLTVAALVVGANANAHTEHTYLQSRPQGVNLPMEYTTFNERMTSKLEGRFGGNFMVTGFYSDSTDESEIGKYYGVANKSTFLLNRGLPAGAVTTADYELGYMIHDHTNEVANANETKVTFSPKEEFYGARFDYYQNLDKIAKGLYLKANLPIVGVKREMGMTVVNDTPTGEAANVIKFLNGTYFKNGPDGHSNDQIAMTNALITSGKHTETGVADIEITLGYKFLYRSKYHVALNLGLTIPTGEDAHGKYLNEAIYGNGGHFAFGGGLDIQGRVWGDHDHNIKLNLVANYRYLFEASEKRTYRLSAYSMPYVLLGQDGTRTGLIPSSNVLTLNSDVTPGSMFDGIFAMAYNNGGFCFDLGYNMYFREDEDVHVKGDLPTAVGSRYGVAARSFAVADHTFGSNAADFDDGGTWLTKKDLDVDAASTPSQFTNSIYGGLGYAFKEWQYPLLMGIGGKYEWASKNSAYSQWQVWGKLALSF